MNKYTHMSFPVTHSVLSTHALQHTLELHYNIPAIKQLSYFQAGLNDTYLVATKKHKYILRAYRKNWRSESDIRYEIDALSFLQRHNISVSNAISRTDGEYITEINAPEGLRYLVLFSYITGVSPAYKENYREEAANYGQIFGKLHQTLKQFSSPHKRFEFDLPYLLNHPLQLIKPFFSHRMTDWKFLTTLSENLIKKYRQLELKNLQKGFCHGDLNTANAHIHNGEIGLFDFDCCGYGYLAADIAAFRWGARIEGKEERLWPHFIRAYLNENPLSDNNLNAVEIFVSMRHIWHIGLHIQLSEDRGRHWLNDEYFDRQIQLLKSWEGAQVNSQS